MILKATGPPSRLYLAKNTKIAKDVTRIRRILSFSYFAVALFANVIV